MVLFSPTAAHAEVIEHMGSRHRGDERVSTTLLIFEPGDGSHGGEQLGQVVPLLGGLVGPGDPGRPATVDALRGMDDRGSAEPRDRRGGDVRRSPPGRSRSTTSRARAPT